MDITRRRKHPYVVLVPIVGVTLVLLSVIGTFAGSADARSGRARPAVEFPQARPTASPAFAGAIKGIAARLGVPGRVGHATPVARPTVAAVPGPSDPPTRQPTAPGPVHGPSAAPTPSRSPTSSPSPSPGSPSGSSASPTPSPAGPIDPSVVGETLQWSDEFTGAAGSAADPARWGAAVGGRWGNGELECYTDDRANSALDGHGDLVLTARHTPDHTCNDGATNQYTSARLTTDHLASADYGKVRVRAELPVAQGVWPAIWGLGADNDSVGWPNAGEIDMAEAIGQSQTMYGNIHFPSNSGPAGLGTGHTLSSPMNTNFHIYGMDWSPDAVSLSVDGVIYKTITRSDVQAAGGSWVFDRPFFLILNVAVGGYWPGNPKDNSVFPQSMVIDYVRVYH